MTDGLVSPSRSPAAGSDDAVAPAAPPPQPRTRTAEERATFKQELTRVIPHLRAFARGLCGRPDMADDLVQETMLKAWAAQDRFEPARRCARGPS